MVYMQICFALIVGNPAFLMQSIVTVVVKVSTKQIVIQQIELANKRHLVREQKPMVITVAPLLTSSSSTSTNARPVTFSEFCSRKEGDRSKHFKRKKDGKRIKLHDKSGKSSEMKINIGIMTKREDVLIVKRGVTLPATVRTNINYDELIKKAVEKHHRFNKDIIKHDDKMFYYLLYGDKKKADKLPGCDEAFSLKRYKEEIDKPYSRITLFLCSCADYMASIFNDLFDSDSDPEIEPAIYCMEQEMPETLPSGLYAPPPVVVQVDDEPELNI
jgi:hypothetical protein